MQAFGSVFKAIATAKRLYKSVNGHLFSGSLEHQREMSNELGKLPLRKYATTDKLQAVFPRLLLKVKDTPYGRRIQSIAIKKR